MSYPPLNRPAMTIAVDLGRKATKTNKSYPPLINLENVFDL